MDKIMNIKKENNNQGLNIILGSVVGGILGSVVTYSIMSNGSIIPVKSSQISQMNYSIKEVGSPVEAIAESVSPSVVGIKVKFMQAGIFGTFAEAEGEGSGIIYSKDGYIITNYHVIEDAVDNSQATVTVYLNGNSENAHEATVIGGDEITDIAVIKLKDQNIELVPAKLGKSEGLKVGSLAVAIGNPLGLEFAGTVTGGYISGINRNITAEGKTLNLIQTDAAINEGNSGGALVNGSGEIIGINTAKIGASGVEGLGFAIPIDTAKPIITELISNKKISRPYIGIGGVNIDNVTAEKYNMPQGIYVQEVEKSSPASLAGIKVGDIIVKADGKKVTSMEKLNEIKYEKKVGDKFNLVVKRNNKDKDIVVVLGEN